MNFILAVLVITGSVSLLHATPGRPLVGQWAVELRGDGQTTLELERMAQIIARENGLVYRGPVRSLHNCV